MQNKSNKPKNLIIILVSVGAILFISLVAVGYSSFESNKDQSSLFASSSSSSKTNSNSSNSKANSSMSSDTPGTVSSTPDSGTQTAGIFTDYSSELVSESLDTEKVVLFFHAKWCSSCKVLNDNLESQRDSIPSDTKILKVDFDSSTDLRRKYGVTTQHTLVLVDNDGQKLKQESGLYKLNTVDDLVNFTQI